MNPALREEERVRELRKDPVTQRWILVSTDYAKSGGDPCPFCPGKERNTPPEIYAIREPQSQPNGPGWWTRVVPDKYPFLIIQGELDRRAEGIYDTMNGVGAHELVIETPDHHLHWGTMEAEQLERIFLSYQQRLLDLRRDERFRFIMISKNFHFYTSLIEHPHSHIVALPVVPRGMDLEIEGTLRYYKLKERCIFCDMIREEQRTQKRIILESEHYIAFVPFASRYSFESWILPKVHQPDFGEKDQHMDDLAVLTRTLIAKIMKAKGDPPYSVVVHTTPNPPFYEERYHWHLEVRPRVYEGMGFEWGSGFFVTYTAPEEAATILRQG